MDYTPSDTVTEIVLTPAQRARMKAALYGSDEDNYFGLDTLTPQQAEIVRLRDALTEAEQELDILRGELQAARTALGWMVAEHSRRPAGAA